METPTKFWKKYESWVRDKGCETRYLGYNRIAKIISALEAFIEESKEPRAAIAIANSGLCGGFLAEGLGIEAYVVDCHVKGNGTVYRELDDFNIAGKDVLIIEDDIDSGKTISRVSREILAKRPNKVSFLLYYEPSGISEVSIKRNGKYSSHKIYAGTRFPESPNAVNLIEKIEQS